MFSLVRCSKVPWVALLAAVLLVGCASDDANNNNPPADTGAEQGTDDATAGDGGLDTVETDAEPVTDTGPLPDSTVDSGPTGPWQKLSNPAKVTLNDIWGTSSDNIYAVGMGGIVLHWDGKLWEAMNNTETADLYGIYGVSSNTIFAVGDGIAVVYSLDKCLTASTPDAGADDGGAVDGGVVDLGAPPDPCPPGQYCDKDGFCKPGTWKEAYSSTYQSGFRAVWGTEINNVWAVGLEGTAKQKTGSSSYWSSKTTGIDEDLHDLIGFSENEMYAVGAGGTIAKYDGTDWTKMDSGVTSDLQSIWGPAGNDLYAVGLDGTVVHYDGTAWKKVSVGTQSYLYGVWGTSAKDVWVVGHSVFAPNESAFHFDGSKWSNVTPSIPAGGLNGVWTSKANEAFVVGNFSLLRYNK